MDVPEHLDSFEQWVDRRVAGAAASGDFSTLLRRLPGIYPVDVVDALSRLGSAGQLADTQVRRLLQQAGQRTPRSGKQAQTHHDIPAPHPLDFEWRFAFSASSRLAELSEQAAGMNGSIAVLGAPSLIYRQHHPLANRDLTLFDANVEILSALRRAHPRVHFVQCDLLRDPLPVSRFFSSVVADPPWYPEHLHAFVWAASHLSCNGTMLFLSIPPFGTRPGIPEERSCLLQWCTTMGFGLVRIEHGVLPYLTPPFERNALKSVGIRGIPDDWRRGDLAVFRKERDALAMRPPPPATLDRWQEERLGAVRFRLRTVNTMAFCDPRLISLVEGDILPAVSRRDPRRRNVDLWTTGNRVFGCHGTWVLQHIICAIAAKDSPLKRISTVLDRSLFPAEAEQIEAASNQILNLLQLEVDELETYFEEPNEAAIDGAVL